MLQKNVVNEVVSDDTIEFDQSCGESSDDLFGDVETKSTLQAVAESSTGYHSGSSTDISEYSSTWNLCMGLQMLLVH